MCWFRHKTFEGWEQARYDWLLCSAVTAAMRHRAPAGHYFLTSCQGHYARQSHANPETIDQPNCCALMCCGKSLQMHHNRVRYLETEAGVGAGQRKGFDFLINDLPQLQHASVLEFKNVQAV
jgi:hypothetical protein